MARKRVGKYPSFREFRQDNPVMIPDRGFTRQLHKLDKELNVKWDWGSEKWEIWKTPKDKPPYHVTTVQTTNKSYRQLGADILLRLQKFSPDKYTVVEIVEYLEEKERQERRRKEKDLQNKIKDIAMETYNYVRGVLQVSVPDVIKPSEIPKGQTIGRIVANE